MYSHVSERTSVFNLVLSLTIFKITYNHMGITDTSLPFLS